MRDIAIWVKFNGKKEEDQESFDLKLLLVETNLVVDVSLLRQWIEIPKEPMPTSIKNFKIMKQPENQRCVLSNYVIESKRLLIECEENENKQLVEIMQNIPKM